MQEASRFFGQSLYKELRVDFRESINSFRAERSSGITGLQRTARSEWHLDRLLKVEGLDAYEKRIAELLAGEYKQSMVELLLQRGLHLIFETLTTEVMGTDIDAELLPSHVCWFARTEE